MEENKVVEAVSMDQLGAALEESYKMMGDGEHDTDTLLAWEKITAICENKETIKVTVDGIVNKGVIANVEGIRGFIPASRLDTKPVEDTNAWLGKEIEVRIIQADMAANKLVLSAREILREKQNAERKQRISDIPVGAVLEGTVESLQTYGAFVSLGEGITGLVHISEISDKRIKHPKNVLEEGQTVNVKVIKNQDGKIGLSIKALIEPEEEEIVEEDTFELPEAENIGTSLGDLFKGLKF